MPWDLRLLGFSRYSRAYPCSAMHKCMEFTLSVKYSGDFNLDGWVQE